VIGSLARKILIPAMILVAISMILMGAILSYQSSREMDRALRAKGQSLSQLLEQISGNYLLNFDFVGLDSLVKVVARDSTVHGLGILDGEGKLVTDSAIYKGISQPMSLILEKEIRQGDTKLGLIRVAFHQPSFRQQFMDNLSWISLIMLIGLAVVAAGMVFIIRRELCARLDKLIYIAKDIAQGDGDLRQRLPEEPADELGQLSHWINQFSQKLSVVVRELIQMSESIHKDTTQLKTVFGQVSEQSRSSERNAVQVDQTTQQVVNGFTVLTSDVEGLSHSVGTIAAAAEEMSASLKQVQDFCTQELKVAQNASKEALSATNLVADLGEQSKKISKVLEVIQDVAARTNLLALNATIEAASAGESGKGFAVVASEVKELARQTGGAVDDIRKQISSMQDMVQRTVQAIGNISKVIEEVQKQSGNILKSVEEQGHTVQEITLTLSSTGNSASGIARKTKEASMDLHRAMDAIHSIRDASSDATRVIQSTAQGMESLQKTASGLNQVSGQFKV
jgi:methyl-accepting chemotaxis protein